jgi:hypothetical protein
MNPISRLSFVNGRNALLSWTTARSNRASVGAKINLHARSTYNVTLRSNHHLLCRFCAPLKCPVEEPLVSLQEGLPLRYETMPPSPPTQTSIPAFIHRV